MAEINFFMRHLRTGTVSNEIVLNEGKYNEFYLPAIDLEHEAWLVITDDDGTETTLHLKR